MWNTMLEENKGSCGVSKGGILKNERGAEGDTAGKEAVENGKGVNLLGLRKGVAKGAELEKVWVVVATVKKSGKE